MEWLTSKDIREIVWKVGASRHMHKGIISLH